MKWEGAVRGSGYRSERCGSDSGSGVSRRAHRKVVRGCGGRKRRRCESGGEPSGLQPLEGSPAAFLFDLDNDGDRATNKAAMQ
jgi:hypothetical protein